MIINSNLFSDEQIKFICSNCTENSRKELADLFNANFKTEFKISQFISFIKNHKVNSGRTGHFEKGLKPWNAGTKGVMKPNRTSFKKGRTPANRKPIGHERVCSKNGYVLVKVDQVNPYTGHQGRYRAKHIVIWEEANGEIPKGMIVRFKDGNNLNCHIDNLQLVSRALNLRLNHNKLNSTVDELKPTVRLLSELEVKVHERAKGN